MTRDESEDPHPCTCGPVLGRFYRLRFFIVFETCGSRPTDAKLLASTLRELIQPPSMYVYYELVLHMHRVCILSRVARTAVVRAYELVVDIIRRLRRMPREKYDTDLYFYSIACIHTTYMV